MTYDQFIAEVLEDLGFDLVTAFNCFVPPYHAEQGWHLRLPAVDFSPTTLILLHFQDFITPGDSIIELDRVERFYRDRCHQVLVIHWSHDLQEHYRGPVNLIEFSSHNMITIQTIVARQREWALAHDQPRDRSWQCLNGRECDHRRRAYEILRDWPDGILSFGDVKPLDTWSYSTYRGTENDENFVRLKDVYARAKINIVTETQYHARPGIVTEKTLMAMIAGQIPIVIGHPGLVEDCVDLGFDMFADLVDVSYDYLPNHERVEQAIMRNRDLILGHVDTTPYQERIMQQQRMICDRYIDSMKKRFYNQSAKLASHLLRSP